MKKFTASVVGGGRGGKLSIESLIKSDCYEIVAIADLSESVRKTWRDAIPGLKTFADYHEMFRTCPTDVVCVSTYSPSHEEITRAAIDSGVKGLLVEKPLAHNSHSAAVLLQAIKAAKIPVVTPHNMWTLKFADEVYRRLKKGEIGQYLSMDIQIEMWDISSAGVHWLNYFVKTIDNEPMDYLLAQCDGTTRTYREGMKVETIGTIRGATKSGIRLTLESGDYVRPYGVDYSGEGDEISLIRIVGSTGMIEMYPWRKGYYICNKEFPDGMFIVPEEYPVTWHQSVLEKLAGMIESGEHDYTISESALTAVQLVEAAFLSNRHHCMVKFPLSSFTPPEPSGWDVGTAYQGEEGRDGMNLPPKSPEAAY